MARSRHGHRVEESTGGAGLPSWAQRHLGEAGEPVTETVASPSRHRRRAAPEPAHRLRGWGVAIVSVAAAVGAVPLAISSVAADRSDDPLPTVDTFTAGAPGPLESGEAPQRGTRTVPAPAPGDPATGGILQAPAGAPGAPPVAGPAPAGPAPLVPVPQPAAVVRPTVPAPSATTTAPAKPLAGTTTTKPKPTPTTTTGGGGDDDGGGKSAPKPQPAPAKPPASSSGSGNSGSSGNSGRSDGLLPAVGRTAGGVVRGVTGTVGGLL